VSTCYKRALQIIQYEKPRALSTSSYKIYAIRKNRCRHRHSSDDGEGGAEPDPSVVDDKVGRVGDKWSVVSVELARLVRRTSPLPAWTHESRVIGVLSVVCVELARLVRRTSPLKAWTHESRVC